MRKDQKHDFENRYKSMDTDELVELHRKGTLLPDAEAALVRVLESRGITDTKRAQIASELEATSYDDSIKHLAPLGSRIMARFIDTAISIVIGAAAFVVFVFFSISVALIACPVALLSYMLLADCMPHGQSVGKKLNGIAVVGILTRSKCTAIQSIIRNFFLLAFGIIDIALVQGHTGQRIGDRLAGTQVVKINYASDNIG